MSYQTTIIAGNLGKDPELKYLPNGTAVTNFSVAVSEQYKTQQGETVKRTIWYRVSTFGKQAETCNQYLKKGSKVLVEGRLNADPNTGGPRVFTKQDGTASASFELTAATVRFLSSSAKSEGTNEAPVSVLADEDIPF